MPTSISICSPTGRERANLLAKRISRMGNGNLTLYRWQNRAWSLWSAKENDWNYTPPPNPPDVAILFHHIGDGLETHRPDGATYQCLVRFSAGGLAVDVNGNSCNLPPSFRVPNTEHEDTCPLYDEDIQQFIDWAGGTRSEPPDICLGRPKASALRSAVALLCEAYLLTWRSLPNDQPQPSSDACQAALSNLPPEVTVEGAPTKWEDVQRPKWWKDVIPHKPDPQKLKLKLFDHLFPDNGGEPSTVTPELVCEAYQKVKL